MPIKRTFDRQFISLIIVFSAILLLIGALPYLFTHYSILDFTQTGQIGDTIGGILGPFVAIIGALLTFIAFWVQFKANERQFEIINKQQEKEKIETIEKQYFFLLQHYFRLEEQLSIGGWVGKSTFGILLHELKFTVDVVFASIKGYYHLPKAHLYEYDEKTQYAIVRTAVELWYEGNTVKNNDELLEKIVFDFNNLTAGEYGINPNRMPHQYVPSAYPDLENYMFYFINRKQHVINEVEISEFGRGRSKQLSAYFKVVYSILVYINDVDDSIWNYEAKRKWVLFYTELMSDEELELLSFVCLSKMMHGLEIGPKSIFLDMNKMGDSSRNIELINKMIISKYKLFDTIFYRLPATKLSLQMIYEDHTKIGISSSFNYLYFRKLWEKSDK